MKFEIPVTFTCLDVVEVEAETLEAAIQYIKEEKHLDACIQKLDGRYVHGTGCIDDGKQGKASVAETIDLLQ